MGQHLIRFVLWLAFLALLIWFPTLPYVANRGNVFDFYPGWVGAQAYARGESPYAQTVTEATQRGYYGHLVGMERDQHRSAYPAYIYPLLATFTALPFPTAVRLWMAFQALAMAASVILWTRILDWRLGTGRLAGLIVLCLVGYRYSMTVYLLAQYTGWMLLFLSLGVWALQRNRDTQAGVCFALTALTPATAGLLVILILLMTRRWQALGIFALTLGALTLLSIAHIGFWIPDWLDVLGQYTQYAQPLIALSILPLPVRLLSMAALGLWCIRAARGGELRSIVTAATLTVLLVTPQTGIYTLLFALPVLLMSMQRAHGWGWLGVAALFVMTWVWQAIGWREVEMLVMPLYVGVLWFSCVHPMFARYNKALENRAGESI